VIVGVCRGYPGENPCAGFETCDVFSIMMYRKSAVSTEAIYASGSQDQS
jgi:hypothetical protein